MTIPFATFDEWNPVEYLADYYTYVEQDERHTLRFLAQEFEKIEGRPVALEFGIGPTLHRAMSLSPYVREIHVADYLPSNLEEIRKWQKGDIGAHDWKPFAETVLAYEGVPAPGIRDIHQREALTRRRITNHFVGDASSSYPIGRQTGRQYELLLSCYCADSATNDKATWFRYMTNILRLLKPGGFFVTAALRNCQHYKVGDKYFPSANVNEDDFESLFRQLEFDMSRAIIQVENVPEHNAIGYGSIVLASGFTSNGRSES